MLKPKVKKMCARHAPALLAMMTFEGSKQVHTQQGNGEAVALAKQLDLSRFD